jgi:hypothetical protein
MVCAFALAVLASCGSSDDRVEPSVSPSAGADPLGLRGTIDLRGAVTVKGSYDVAFASAAKADCRSFVMRDEDGSSDAASFILPLPTRAGDEHLSWTAAVRPYRGPGTYTIAAIPGLRLAVLDAAGQPARTFTSGTMARATAKVAADGSGSLTFSALGTAPNVVSGTARWTCSD